MKKYKSKFKEANIIEKALKQLLKKTTLKDIIGSLYSIVYDEYRENDDKSWANDYMLLDNIRNKIKK